MSPSSSSSSFSSALGYATILLFTLATLGEAATTHIIQVGKEGSFFDPPTLSAGLNDTVTFVFSGLVHTVTQTSLANPCVRLPGGFNSGVGGTMFTNNSGQFQTWDLLITNVSAPIWFFCEISTPTSHCESGMVGVINPPSIDIYNTWRQSAKLVTSTPTPVFTPILTGIGAFATATPQVPSTPIPSDSTSSTSPSSTDSQTSSSTSASSTSTSTSTATSSDQTSSSKSSTSSHLGAIVGGAVGGAVLLLILLLTIFWCKRRRGLRSPGTSPSSSTADANFFRYNAVSRAPVTRRPSDAFIEAKRLEEKSASAAGVPQRPFSPIRRGQGDGGAGGNMFAPPGVASSRPVDQQQSFRIGGGGGIDRQASFSTNPISPSTDTGHSGTNNNNASNNNIDVHAIANEVVSLLRAPSSNTLGTSNFSSSNNPQSLTAQPEGPRPLKSQFVPVPVTRTESPLGPPAYRTTMGTPDRVR
ncbi:hypothetical protein D9613_002321 [Agrocybe pediades]|uniref:Extracellular serine-rich protein n=1 Tax=Agrocybe pediades TaxID=84607 RepID=A0A8H4R7G1_9AGAR|nr:hypothetical protein D9613_002321 [Agrocybe pediades]